ncbi:GNAT family N-acetyltransferase [Persicirhabdus sediminis]|uniref:GNAT family N-acetyltransferase n=1 Tax=Persicirhabdus sediminis TaxID=454144 RepID=A0A8J7MHB4_9BACT|nr:GNAT family N-acetyltransferase [Persicirhabdus sediminis]MBK1792871.1 GNAT family N-acetyltransferase [Persicirhabdus sediminis]
MIDSNQASPQWKIQPASWLADHEQILAIRYEVFVDEQNVPVELEVDGRDACCHHVLAYSGHSAIGTGRLLPDGHIGRVAVVKSARGQGVGQAIMLALIERASQLGMAEIHLNAQLSALEFYEKLGFVAHGETFIDAGIEHLAMTHHR